MFYTFIINVTDHQVTDIGLVHDAVCPVIPPAFTGTYCTYPQRMATGQAELTWGGGVVHRSCSVVVFVSLQYGAQLRENLRLILKWDESSRADNKTLTSDSPVSKLSMSVDVLR